MKRREIDVWPAVADLMTGVAVLGLAFAAVMSKSTRDLRECQAETDELKADILRLTAMQRAVSVADDAMREVGDTLGLPRQEDLSIVFGDNLVSFSTNEVTTELSAAGVQELQRFCGALGKALSVTDATTGRSRAELVVLQVEGHTDGHACPKEPGCNWRFSAERAARFRALLDQASLCPGSSAWTIRPIGLANTQQKANASESRRIELRLVPDYSNILDGVLEP